MKIDDSEYGNKEEKLNGEKKATHFYWQGFLFYVSLIYIVFPFVISIRFTKKKIYKKHSTVKKSTCYEKTLCAGMLKLVVLRAMFQNCG